jgi:hypothetical protein
MDTDAIIDALGGNRTVADTLGVYPSAVAMWRNNGIPTKRCLELCRLAKRLGVTRITLEVLLKSREPKMSEKLNVRKGKRGGAITRKS